MERHAELAMGFCIEQNYTASARSGREEKDVD